jgi:hypothetical protein
VAPSAYLGDAPAGACCILLVRGWFVCNKLTTKDTEGELFSLRRSAGLVFGHDETEWRNATILIEQLQFRDLCLD